MNFEQTIVLRIQQTLWQQHKCRIDVDYKEGVGALFWREQDPHDAQHVIHVLRLE